MPIERNQLVNGFSSFYNEGVKSFPRSKTHLSTALASQSSNQCLLLFWESWSVCCFGPCDLFLDKGVNCDPRSQLEVAPKTWLLEIPCSRANLKHYTVCTFTLHCYSKTWNSQGKVDKSELIEGENMLSLVAKINVFQVEASNTRPQCGGSS